MRSAEYAEDKENGHYIFGTATVGERGQIVIPVKARRLFDINPGDRFIVHGDKNRGIALIKANDILNMPLPGVAVQPDE
ncbi:MAG: AbrB/MazE/SpoVT family DNA-binding domain-containing protein [Oscillospiraceae bacterium]|nr:AbrB/MazE/SpoVT family DNA-binding domain-containing protein [Oscillospiraceae bacterium]